VDKMASQVTIDPNNNFYDYLLGILRSNERGEFTISGLTHIKFEFDTVKGTIKPVSTGEGEGVNISYNPSMFDYIIEAGQAVMSLLAGCELLLGLKQLNDSGINKIISQSKIETAQSMKEMTVEVSKTLFELLELTKPSKRLFSFMMSESKASSGEQKQDRAIIYNTISQNIKHIRSKADARNILEKLESKQERVQSAQIQPGR